MKKIVAVLVVGAMFANALVFSDQDRKEPKKRERNPVMQKKLEHSQKLLEGIALADFRMIEIGADELSLLSKRAEWQAVKTPEYGLRSDEFRRNAYAIAEKSKEKNLDGVVLAYVQLTMSCVKCHEHLRDIRMAGVETEEGDSRFLSYVIGTGRK